MKLHVQLNDSGHLVAASKSKLPTEDECAQLVADINFSMVEELLRQLIAARRSSGRKPEEVARILGVSPEILKEIEGGEYDLTVDDLREYLYAIDAIGTFRITPNASKAIYSHLLKSASQAIDHMWRESAHDEPDARADLSKSVHFLKSGTDTRE